MANPGNQHCASCIGTLSFPILARGQITSNAFSSSFVTSSMDHFNTDFETA